MNTQRMTGHLVIRVSLWGIFATGLAFLVLNGISTLGVMVAIGMLLMALDYPKKEQMKSVTNVTG